MRRSARFLLPLLVCLYLASPALAGTVSLQPLEDSGYDSYWYYFPKADVSLPLPLNAQLQELLSSPRKMGIAIGLPDFPDTYFAFFAFYSEDFRGLALADMEEDSIRGVLDMISTNAGAIRYAAVDGLAPGQRVLRAKEPAQGVVAEHLLALRDGWVLNMMAANVTGAPLSKEEVDVQELLMQNAIAPEGMAKHYQSYTLPGSAITLGMPDSMYIVVSQQSRDFLQLSLCPKRPGAQFSVLQLFAVRDEAYAGQTVLTLPKDTKEEALNLPSPGSGYDASSLQVLDGFLGNTPVLSYTCGRSFRSLLAIRDGWALYAAVLPFADFMDPAFVDALQEAAMRMLLGEEATLPDWLPAVPVTWEGNTLHVPLTTGVMDIRIPKGYGVDITEDTAKERHVFLYALDGSSRYFHIATIAKTVFHGDKTFADLLSAQELRHLVDGTTENVGGMGYAAASEMTAYGPAGLPAVYTTTAEQLYEQYFFTTNSQTVSFSFTSDTTITGEESELLANLII